MNRFRSMAIAATMIFALAAFAQQSSEPAAPAHKMPSAEQHVKVLAEKLNLSAEQQEQILPAIQEMQDSMQKAMDDQSLTPEERHQQTKAAMEKADKQARQFLTDEQKKKLDELEQQPHHGMHGGGEGANPHN